MRELRALDKWDQRFKIDDHLERRESALANLKQAGPERFEDAASYLAKYELYDTAFKLYKDDQEKLIVGFFILLEMRLLIEPKRLSMTFTETTCTIAASIQILHFVSLFMSYFWPHTAGFFLLINVNFNYYFSHPPEKKHTSSRTSLKKHSRRTSVLMPGESCSLWPRRRVCQRSLWMR